MIVRFGIVLRNAVLISRVLRAVPVQAHPAIGQRPIPDDFAQIVPDIAVFRAANRNRRHLPADRLQVLLTGHLRSVDVAIGGVVRCIEDYWAGRSRVHPRENRDCWKAMFNIRFVLGKSKSYRVEHAAPYSAAGRCCRSGPHRPQTAAE